MTCFSFDLRDDDDRLAGGHQSIHASRGNADSLLPSTHLQSMELGAVQQLAEDVLNLLSNNPGSVVSDRDPEAGLGELKNFDIDVREDASLLTGIESIVNGFLDSGQHRLSGIVESQQVTILREEFTDGYLTLTRCHLLGGTSSGCLTA